MGFVGKVECGSVPTCNGWITVEVHTGAGALRLADGRPLPSSTGIRWRDAETDRAWLAK